MHTAKLALRQIREAQITGEEATPADPSIHISGWGTIKLSQVKPGMLRRMQEVQEAIDNDNWFAAYARLHLLTDFAKSMKSYSTNEGQ